MADIVTRVYNNFRGVDFRGEEINLMRSPDALNVWKDYKETESIRTRPALEFHECYENYGVVYSISFYNGKAFYHIGDSLFVEDNKNFRCIYEGLNQNRSFGFVYNDEWYFVDGIKYFQYDKDKDTLKKVVGYIPTTTIARKPMGGGTKYEDVNMLSPYRKNSFLSDGVTPVFALDVMNIDIDFEPIVTVNDEVVEYVHREVLNDEGTVVRFYSDRKGRDVVYEVDYAKGTIDFKGNVPNAPLTDGQDNVVIEFKKEVPEYEDCIARCTMHQVFDNRVFFSGNPEHPNMVWNSSLNDPTYVSDLDYYKEGMDDAAVKGLVAGNNALWVFREPSDANTTVFYHTPSLDDEYGKIYPSAHSSITTGCIGKAINFNDDIVFFSERGMEGISGDVTTEQAIAHRSTLVDRKMTAEGNYEEMVLAEWKGYLFIFMGNSAYLADSRAMFQNENHMEYDFFYWALGEIGENAAITCAAVKDGILYVGTSDGFIYTFTDNEADIESYWVTPLDKFKHPNKLKTTNKRGMVIEGTGDIEVYAKLEDTDFEKIGTYENVTDYFVCRLKRKKFKDLQLKFYSPTRMSLEQVVLECFVGGYIKR